MKILVPSFCALLVVTACEEAAPPPEPSCPDAELVEAIHAAAFHFDHGPVSTARARLDRARSLAGGGSDEATDRLLAELTAISQLVDEDPARAHLENERLRMRLGDWHCLREPAHSALHAKLPPIEGAPRPEPRRCRCRRRDSRWAVTRRAIRSARPTSAPPTPWPSTRSRSIVRR
ncbi:MAG: hypothetical protein M5U28_26085 [Sandaracinaceae bacterium]|nr:hypothetical protein [Sandaracinaceae bacterium]